MSEPGRPGPDLPGPDLSGPDLSGPDLSGPDLSGPDLSELLDTALDVLLYVPVGLALTAADELPKLAAKGRARVGEQVAVAKVVGQFALARGRRELEERFGPTAPLTATAPPAPAAAPGNLASSPGGLEKATSGADTSSASPTGADGPTPVVRSGRAPSSGELAIPGYDSLSASQVVQRLAGLEHDELEAVAVYEQAHRGRRTVLNRIEQLEGR